MSRQFSLLIAIVPCQVIAVVQLVGIFAAWQTLVWTFTTTIVTIVTMTSSKSITIISITIISIISMFNIHESIIILQQPLIIISDFQSFSFLLPEVTFWCDPQELQEAK